MFGAEPMQVLGDVFPLDCRFGPAKDVGDIASILLRSSLSPGALPDAHAEACQHRDEPARARLQPKTCDVHLGHRAADAGDGRLKAHCTQNTSTERSLEPFGIDQLFRVS